MAWNDEPPKEEELKSSWADAPPSPHEIGKDPSEDESFLRQAASGATRGFDDESGGVFGALGRIGGVKNLASWKPFDSDSHLEYDSPTLDYDKLKDAYVQNRDALRADQHSDSINPAASLAGQVVGNLATPIKGPPGLNPYVQTGLEGAAFGVGTSEDDLDSLGTAKDAGVNAGLNMLTHGLVKPISKAAGYVAEKLPSMGRVGTKLASTLSGVPEKEIETYAKNSKAIDMLAKSSDNNVQEMADQLKSQMNDSIFKKKAELNKSIADALSGASKEKTVDITSVIESLEAHKQSLDPSLHSDAISDIDELISRVKGTTKIDDGSVLGYAANTNKTANVMSPNETQLWHGPENVPTGVQTLDTQASPWAGPKTSISNPDSVPVINNIEDEVISLPVGGSKTKYLTNVQKLNQIKKFLQTQGSAAFGSTPLGFQVGKTAAQAAKGASGEANALMGIVAPKEIAAANKSLTQLHDIEDVMNKGLLTEGKSASPLLAAGSGNNQAHEKILKQLGDFTGTDMLGGAQNLSAARTFGNPSLVPVDTTGKSLTRMGVAAGAGFLIGGVPGAVAAQGLTSPAAIKAGIKTGQALSVGGDKLGELLSKSPADFGRYANTLRTAAARGGNALAAAHYVLQSTDPEYREQTKGMFGDDGK